ncbi:hypothetical protein [Enhygromyxa salina]|uniref:TIGR02646 family protein n=1 Tax=Enhygromyxa salina TaxID=215803 RepID=A0A2S9YUC0_9BACT|nr:hypothetical protein [Enhygromyxa salina]PRQ08711.1 hypothetical protein ENSA7_15290 [Enhygromyxa salina]
MSADLDPGDPQQVVSFIGSREKQIDAGYDVVREPLRAACHRKCAYCEREVERSAHIDHFRPRRPHKGSARSDAHPGYWWLTWSWSNLLSACLECSLRKGGVFDVEGRRMCPWSTAVAGEQPRLLDPSVVDPQAHLECAVDDGGTSERWTVQGRTPEGMSTARALALDTPSDRYDTHLGLLRDVVEDLRLEASRGPSAVREKWRRKIRILVGRESAPYRTLSRAYLAHHLGAMMREYDLALPPLHDSSPPAPPEPMFADDERFAELDENLELRVRALGKRPASHETRDLILTLVKLHPRTVDELAGLLPQTRQALRRHLQELKSNGQLRFDGTRATAMS